MSLKLKRNSVAWATGESTAGMWVTQDDRFLLQEYKKGWAVYASEADDLLMIRRHEIEGTYFPTRKAASEALESALADPTRSVS